MTQITNEKVKFNFSFENHSMLNYLVLEIDSHENILDYQIEMINNNLNQGIIGVKCKSINNKKNLYFDVTSKLSLEKFLSKRKLTSIQLINILKGIVKTILHSKELLLYDNSFILDEKYMYIDIRRFEISMVYIPLKLDCDVKQTFKEFIKHLIVSLVRLEEASSDNFIYKILSFLKQDVFDIYKFLQLLDNIGLENSNENFSDLNKHKKLEKEQNKITQYQHEKSFKLNNLSNNSRQELNDNSYSMVKPDEHKSYKESDDVTITKKTYKPVYIIIAAASQVLILAVLFLAQNIIINANDDVTTTYAGIGILVVAIDFFIFKNLFKKENMTEKKIKKSKNNNKKRVAMSKQDRSIKNKLFLKNSKKQASELINLNKKEICSSQMNESVDTAILRPDDDKDTELLQPDNIAVSKAYLEKIEHGTVIKIPITKSEFVIGRHGEYADYILDNKAIGRMHAEIIIREDSYFVKDLNSRNGTKINDLRIESNKEYQVKNEDMISLANIEHIFIISDSKIQK